MAHYLGCCDNDIQNIFILIQRIEEVFLRRTIMITETCSQSLLNHLSLDHKSLTRKINSLRAFYLDKEAVAAYIGTLETLFDFLMPAANRILIEREYEKIPWPQY